MVLRQPPPQQSLMVLLQFSHSPPRVLPQFFHVLPRFSHGSPTIQRRLSHRSPIYIPPIVFPQSCHDPPLSSQLILSDTPPKQSSHGSPTFSRILTQFFHCPHMVLLQSYQDPHTVFPWCPHGPYSSPTVLTQFVHGFPKVLPDYPFNYCVHGLSIHVSDMI